MRLTTSNRVSINSRHLAVAWLAVFCALLLTAFFTLPKLQFETNILELLPNSEKNPLIIEAQQKQNALLNQTIVWLVGGNTEKEAYEKAAHLETSLKQSQLFEEIQFHWSSNNAVNTYKTLLPYRYHFLTAQQKQLIIENPDQFVRDKQQLLYSPLGMQYAATLQQDPLFTLGSYINDLNNADIDLYQDVAIMKKDQHAYALILTKVGVKNSDTAKHDKLIAVYQNARQSFDGNKGLLLVAGFPLYSAFGAQSAQHEISTIGTLSTLSVILLLLFAFRSAKPLLLSLVSISVGVLAALTICNIVFDRVHIITLVFGSSLIGCIDYSFHYFCNSFQKDWNSFDGLKSIFASIGLGMLGSVIAFSSLALTPFPGLQQMAIFSASGLFFAWLTVVLLFPYLSTEFRCHHHIPLSAFYPWYLEKWPAFFQRFRWPLILATLLLIPLGFSKLNLQDDVRSMQKAKPELLSQENAIRAIFKQKNDTQYFIVKGNNTDEVLEKEQNLANELKKAIVDHALESYTAISEVYPSARQQLQNQALIEEKFVQNGKLQQLLTQLDMQPEIIASIEKNIQQSPKQAMEIETWLNAAPPQWHQQWLGCHDDQCASIINLKGIHDINRIKLLADNQNSYFVDQLSTINNIMLQYRHIATLFVAAAAALIAFMLMLPLGFRAAIIIISIPLTAILMTIAITGFIGTPFNLFNVFALILVLGIAFDYSIFHYLGEDHKQSTSFAILLSLTTTTLSFGLLMLSETTVIQSFGLTLSIGIAIAFILSPLISAKNVEVFHDELN